MHHFRSRYSLWRLGEHRIITRAQIHAATQSSPGSEHSIATVVKAKMEHHGNKASDEEEVTPEELVRWWSATHVRPGAHALVRLSVDLWPWQFTVSGL